MLIILALLYNICFESKFIGMKTMFRKSTNVNELYL